MPESKIARSMYQHLRYLDNPKRHLKLAKESYQRNKEKVAAKRLLDTHGLTVLEYNKMYQGQGGTCAIFFESFDKLCVDHCHETGRIRGLLCGACNKALGFMMDNIARLTNAITYLGK